MAQPVSIKSKSAYVDNGDRAKDGGYKWKPVNLAKLPASVKSKLEQLEETNRKAKALRAEIDALIIEACPIAPPSGFEWSITHRFGTAMRPERIGSRKVSSGEDNSAW